MPLFPKVGGYIFLGFICKEEAINFTEDWVVGKDAHAYTWELLGVSDIQVAGNVCSLVQAKNTSILF